MKCEKAQEYTGNAGRMEIDAIFGKAGCEIRQIRRRPWQQDKMKIKKDKIEILVIKEGKINRKGRSAFYEIFRTNNLVEQQFYREIETENLDVVVKTQPSGKKFVEVDSDDFQ